MCRIVGRSPAADLQGTTLWVAGLCRSLCSTVGRTKEEVSVEFFPFLCGEHATALQEACLDEIVRTLGTCDQRVGWAVDGSLPIVGDSLNTETVTAQRCMSRVKGYSITDTSQTIP